MIASVPSQVLNRFNWHPNTISPPSPIAGRVEPYDRVAASRSRAHGRIERADCAGPLAPGGPDLARGASPAEQPEPLDNLEHHCHAAGGGSGARDGHWRLARRAPADYDRVQLSIGVCDRG